MKNYLANKMNAVREGMKDNKGFSLVELIIVVAIMAVLMGILAPQYLRFVESSREQTDASAANEVAKAITIALATVEGSHDTKKFVWSASTGTLTYGGDDLAALSAATTPDPFALEVLSTVGDMPDVSSVKGKSSDFTFGVVVKNSIQVPTLQHTADTTDSGTTGGYFADKIGVEVAAAAGGTGG